MSSLGSSPSGILILCPHKPNLSLDLKLVVIASLVWRQNLIMKKPLCEGGMLTEADEKSVGSNLVGT